MGVLESPLGLVALIVLVALLGFVGIVALDMYLDRKTDADDAPARRTPSPALPLEPSDLSWRRSGELLVGQYGEFKLDLRVLGPSADCPFPVYVRVFKDDWCIHADRAASHDEAARSGLTIIQEHLDARQLEDRFLASVTGAPARPAAAPAAHGPEVRRRYLA